MSTTWQGVWLVCILPLLAACSRQPTPVSLAANPVALESAYQEGRVAFKAGRFEDAASQFARVVAADPEHLRARLNWAAALSYTGKTVEAIVQCQNVLTRDPTIAEAYYQWGAVLVRLGRHQEAVEKFDQALALKPMTELLHDEPALQYSLEGYLRRQRTQESGPDIKVSRPPPATVR